MECERCKQRPATVHLTQIINNQKKTMNLCEPCAREFQTENFGFLPQMNLHNLLAGLFHHQLTNPFGQQGIQQAVSEGEICPRCGLSERRFAQQGLLGCGECYSKFGDKLEPVFRRIHGNNRHTGKVPERTGGKVKITNQINKLKNSLKEAVEREEFELAAQFRDQIKELEKKLGGEENACVN
ncbi:nucleotide excision repair protein, with UvrB/UvrC motif [Desulfocucumis palustris]|uniref:Nucleotide excision repair protein, with UvrB/UvrC motif n=1 Tax=Desulfocucumis palustris TaxID=1898651 RepID=A0A2L2XH94_9FIRM|nr:UvrB/UvrC motif-containing protein [Desulfocucumis palustris]GBF35737.1 nucleotide excision repair protein, with UvrB/UvrC motif [Desulfocucumis palustris]